MMRIRIGLVLAFVSLAVLVLSVHGDVASPCRGEPHIGLDPLPSEVETFDGSLTDVEMGYHRVVAYKDELYISSDAPPGIPAQDAVVERYHPGPDGTTGSFTTFLSAPRVIYPFVDVLKDTLWITCSNGTVFSYDGATLTSALTSGLQTSEYVTYMTFFSSNYYLGTNQARVYRWSGSVSASPSTVFKVTTNGAINSLGAFKTEVFGTSVEVTGSDAQLFRSTSGNTGTWTSTDILPSGGKNAYLCGVTDGYAALFVQVPGSKPLGLHGAIWHFTSNMAGHSMVAESTLIDFYSRYFCAFYWGGVEYVFANSSSQGSKCIISDSADTSSMSPSRVVVGCDRIGSYLYIITLPKGVDPDARQSHSIIAINIDLTAPTLVEDTTQSTATTGEPLTFNVKASDDFGIDRVRVEIWNGSSTDHALIDMTLASGTILSGTWTYDLTISGTSAETLHYIIHVMDKNGNEMVTSTKDVSVLDNDAPVLTSDGSDTSATTGEAFRFSAAWVDNIGIQEARVEYWFGSGVHEDMALAGTGPFLGQVTVPTSSVESLYYILSATDSAGNTEQTAAKEATVRDNDRPNLGADTTPQTMMAGRAFTFSKVVEDNIGVQGAYVEYWFGTGSPTNESLTGPSP